MRAGREAVDLLTYTPTPIDPADPWRVEGRLSRGGKVVACSARVSDEAGGALPAPAGCRAVVVTVGARVAYSGLEWWGPTGRARLDAILGGLLERAGAQALEAWVWPRVDSLISDLPTVLDLLRRRRGEPMRVFLEPTALLADSMVSKADDFVFRCAEAVVPLEGIAAVLVTNLGSAPVQAGPVSRRALAGLWRAAVDAGKPVALIGEDVEEQRRWLETYPG